MTENKELQTKEESSSLKGSVLWGMLLFGILLFIDQITKFMADAWLQPGDKIDIIPEWLSLCITYNRGISYGMGDNAPTALKIAVILGTAALMTLLAVFYFKADKRRSFLRLALVFVVAGGVGNLIDRVYYRVWDPTTLYGVRDMVDLSRFGFAVCNFADFFITGGAVMLVLALLFFDKDAAFPIGKKYKALAKEAEEENKKKEKAKAKAKRQKQLEKEEKKAAKKDETDNG
ncbi:MAG: signal peptidase II [Clostridia bacterium]|nr:signal peptidase II [Clostridia bacterium]